jgi:redox-sensitive bicupin YhaK (pirin superfamily)
MIYIAQPEERHIINQGRFIIRAIAPGLKLNNPTDNGIGPLGRVDHATLAPGMIVRMHPHQNDEILSYMRRGTMVHEDTHHNKVPIHGSYLMMMNAGSGIMHEESVPADDTETVEMLQIFIRPQADDLEPRVQFHQFNAVSSTKALRLVGGPEARPGSTTHICIMLLSACALLPLRVGADGIGFFPIHAFFI